MLFFFLFVKKKNKMHDLGNDGWEDRKGEGEEEEAGGGGGFGRDNKKYCTYNTVFHSSLSFI